MNRNVIALAIVAVLGCAAVAWLAFAPAPKSPAAQAPAAVHESVSTNAAEPSDVAPSAASETNKIGAISEANDGASQRALPTASTADLSWIDGKVRMPAGTPADELLELWAFATSTDPTRSASDMSRTAVSEAEHKDLVARCPVTLDGAFHCGVPNDRGALWLVLAGRYCYCDAGVRVDVGAGDKSASFEPTLGAWITGRVQTPADASEAERDLSKDSIELGFDPLRVMSQRGMAQLDELRSRRTACDGELAFEFRGARTGVEYRLQIQPKLLAAARTESFSTSPGQHVVVDPRLARGGTLVGKVHGSDGKPVAGAKLEATVDPLMFGRGGFKVRESKSEADGTFRLEAVAAGKLQLGVEADGYLEASRDLELGEAQRVDGIDFVLDGGATISGRVTWPDGSPVADIKVDIDFDLSQLGGMGAFNALKGADGEGKTDSDGRFQVGGLGKGPFTVKVSARAKDANKDEAAPSADDKERWRARIDGVKPGTKELELVLNAPQGVAGRVTGRDGQPIGKFTVVARSESKGMIPGLGAEKVSQSYTDANGEFFLSGMANGAWDIAALADGFAPSQSTPLKLPVAGDAPRIELVLDRVGSISGVVFDPAGAVAVNAEVTLKLGMQEVVRAGMEDRKPPRTRTDAEGKFTLTGLAAGTHSVVAHAEGHAESKPAVVDLAAEQHVEDIEVRLRDGGLLTGEIFGNDGKALAGASVMVQVPTDPMSQRWGSADGAGQFEFPHLAPGQWQVIHMPMNQKAKAASDGVGDGEQDDASDALAIFADMKLTVADIIEGETTHVVLGAPPKNPVHIHGRAVLDGKGVANAILSFIADGGKGMDQLKLASTSADGAYSIDLQQPGGYLVTVQRAGLSGQQQSCSSFVRVPEQPDFEHDIALPVAGISGTVRNADGSLAADCRVSLMVDGAVSNGALLGENYAEIATDASGNYELIWLREGTYTVGVGGATFGGMFGANSTAPPRQLRSGLHVREGEWLRDVDFKLGEPGAIHGLVRDATDKPLAGAAIFVRDGQGRLLERLSMLTSDSTGRFKVEGLEPGDYAVLARTGDQVTGHDVRVMVHKGETSEVELVISGGTKLIVSLSNEQGEAVECRLEVTDQDGRQVNGMMSLEEIMAAMSQGRFSTKEQTIGPLAPGKYRVVATANDGKSVTKPVTLSGQAERRLKLTL